jgi:AraC-like DNA-binding protein
MPYIKCYYIYESDLHTSFEDTVFPSGCIEIIFNLGTGKWQTAVDNTFVTTPPIELWGQIIRPLPIKSIGKNTMLGIRFYPHAAAGFLREKVDLFNNQVVDFRDLSDSTVNILYARLQETASWHKRIAFVESFLLQRLSLATSKFSKMVVVSDIMVIKKETSLTAIAYDCGYFDQSHFIREFKSFTGYTPSGYTLENSPVTLASANN